jgi:hypothetical protein
MKIIFFNFWSKFIFFLKFYINYQILFFFNSLISIILKIKYNYIKLFIFVLNIES